MERFTSEGIKARTLKVSHAFHSPLVEPMLEPFEKVAAEVKYSSPQIRIISDVSGEFIKAGQAMDERYWREHVRRPVQFLKSMETLFREGYDTFVEVGPNPILTGMGQRCLSDDENSIKPARSLTWVGSLRSGQNDWQQMLENLAELYVQGATVDWKGFDRDYPARKVSLPTYPFQRKRYWIDTGVKKKERCGSLPKGTNPLLGTRLSTATRDVIFENALATEELSFLNDHRYYGMSILPATAFVEIAMAAGKELFGEANCRLEDLTIFQALPVRDGEPRRVQLVVNELDKGTKGFDYYSWEDEDETWVHHASGRLSRGLQPPPSAVVELQAVQKRCLKIVSAETHYRGFGEKGLEFGESLKGLFKRGAGKAKLSVRSSSQKLLRRNPSFTRLIRRCSMRTYRFLLKP